MLHKQKSPHHAVGAFRSLGYNYDAIGLWQGENPDHLFLDDNPLGGLFARFRVGNLDCVDTRLWNIQPVIGIGDVVGLGYDFTSLIDHLNIHFLSVCSPADVYRTIARVRKHH